MVWDVPGSPGPVDLGRSFSWVLPSSRITSQDIVSLPLTSHSVRIGWWCWPITMIPDTSHTWASTGPTLLPHKTPPTVYVKVLFHMFLGWCLESSSFAKYVSAGAIQIRRGQRTLVVRTPPRRAVVWMVKRAWSVLHMAIVCLLESACSRTWSNV